MRHQAMGCPTAVGCGLKPTGAYIPQGQYHADLGVLDQRALNGWWDSLKTIGEKVGRGALDVYGEAQKQEGAAQAYKEQLEAQVVAQAAMRGRTPKWLFPVGIAAGVLGLVLVMRKR